MSCRVCIRSVLYFEIWSVYSELFFVLRSVLYLERLFLERLY